MFFQDKIRHLMKEIEDLERVSSKRRSNDDDDDEDDQVSISPTFYVQLFHIKVYCTAFL